MSSKPKCPEYYRAPLRGRDEIIAWLMDPSRPWSRRGGRDYTARPFGQHSDGYWPFCFNVKLYRVEMTYDSLLAAYKASQGSKEAEDAHWLAETRKRFDDVSTEALFDAGIEDAQRTFVGRRPEGKCEDWLPDSTVSRCSGMAQPPIPGSHSWAARVGGSC